ncbi:MAG TPA: hypothetical protein VIH37_06535, partial [Candidatus Limnocylindrales bacterium]
SSPVHDAAGAVFGGGWLVIGGGRTVAVAGVQAVASSASTIRVSAAGALPLPRADGVAAAIRGMVIVAGGGRGGVADPSVLATRDGVQFSVIGRLAVPVRYPAVAVAGGKVYLFGGATASGETDVVQAIDPMTGRVRVVARLPQPVTEATAFMLGGRILVAGGMRSGRPSAAILAFDPPTGMTSAAGRLPEAVADAGCAVVGETAYLIGGETGSAYLSTVIEVR